MGDGEAVIGDLRDSRGRARKLEATGQQGRPRAARSRQAAVAPVRHCRPILAAGAAGAPLPVFQRNVAERSREDVPVRETMRRAFGVSDSGYRSFTRSEALRRLPGPGDGCGQNLVVPFRVHESREASLQRHGLPGRARGLRGTDGDCERSAEDPCQRSASRASRAGEAVIRRARLPEDILVMPFEMRGRRRQLRVAGQARLAARECYQVRNV